MHLKAGIKARLSTYHTFLELDSAERRGLKRTILRQMGLQVIGRGGTNIYPLDLKLGALDS